MINNKWVAGVCIAAVLGGCETTGTPGAPHTNMDRAIGQCMLTVGAGALIGALVGGNRNRGTGAVVGAGVGAGACAVLLAMASAKDKQELAQAQQAALMTGQAQRVDYVGDDGKARVIQVAAPVAVPDPTPTAAAAAPRLCRHVSGQVAVSNVGNTALPDQIWCQDANGDWSPA